MTFRSKVLARTSSSLEKLLFLIFLANLTTSGRLFLTETAKRRIYGPIPFILAYNQVSVTFRSKVLARRRAYQLLSHPNQFLGHLSFVTETAFINIFLQTQNN